MSRSRAPASTSVGVSVNAASAARSMLVAIHPPDRYHPIERVDYIDAFGVEPRPVANEPTIQIYPHIHVQDQLLFT
ncbi:MAG: hypothetical protein LC799_31385 [Actinobacteria bacterium]|nr:hypothetical protein [Actinomycetota bacterium]